MDLEKIIGKAILGVLTPADDNDGLNKKESRVRPYVIVRCHYAGVHSGYLISKEGRSCRLSQSRRLWYWKPKKGAFLSAVAKFGLDSSSKIGEPVEIELTETCEIIFCTGDAEKSIIEEPSHEP